MRLAGPALKPRKRTWDWGYRRDQSPGQRRRRRQRWRRQTDRSLRASPDRVKCERHQAAHFVLPCALRCAILRSRPPGRNTEAEKWSLRISSSASTDYLVPHRSIHSYHLSRG